MQSCSLFDFLKDKDDKENNEVSQATHLLLVDTEDQTPFDCVLYSEDKTATHFIMDEDSMVREAIICPADNADTLFVSSDEDGFIRSIGNGEITICLDYDDNLDLNCAIVTDEETFLIEKIANLTDIDSGNYTYYAPSRNFRHSMTDGVIEWSSVVQVIGSIINSHISMIIAQVGDNLTVKKALIEIISQNLAVLGLVTDSTVMDIISISGAIASSSTPWGIAIGLITNYDAVVNLFADFWEIIIPLLEKHNEQTNSGQCALQTGIGQLKATLTWNFYADIDLHAYEPSGTHIYFYEPYGDAGYLDYDNTVGGTGSVENIYWENPPAGVYKFYLDYYGPSSYNQLSQTGTCHVAIFFNNVSKNCDIIMSSGSKYVASVTVPTRSANGGFEDDIFLKIEEVNNSLVDLGPKMPKLRIAN